MIEKLNIEIKVANNIKRLQKLSHNLLDEEILSAYLIAPANF